jgi:hypothetical protein
MTSGIKKICAALAAVSGKSIDRLFIVNTARRFELLIVFTDATYYEFHGTGDINGARAIDKGDAAAVRKILERRGGDVVEIGARS